MSIINDDPKNIAEDNNGFSYNAVNNKAAKSLDKTKQNINGSIDESRNQITRYNNIINSYQEQSLQSAKKISEEYIESQKAVINSLQSAWRPYSESFNSLATSFATPDSMTKAYAKLVGSFAENAVSAIRLTNCIIFSNLDTIKSTLEQVKDSAKHISSINANAARTFEQNSRQIMESVEEYVSNYNSSQNNNNYNDGVDAESAQTATNPSTSTTKL